MIIVDYSGVAIANLFAMRISVSEGLVRHCILNSLRLYNAKYRREYGQMVLACDGGGTWKLAQPMVYALLFKQWWLVDKLNHLQGWLLTMPFRWSDRPQDFGFESIQGQVQDYPTMICTTVFLNRMGYKAVIPRPHGECLTAILKYRQDPADFEPNSEWEIDLYREALHKYAAQ